MLKREFGMSLAREVADMVGYSTGAAGGEKNDAPCGLLNDPMVLKYKAEHDVDIKAQRAELVLRAFIATTH